jgi:GntR family transcriptional regulator, transcriptional repressor for pyruvate dehydrogenase complex
MSRSPKIGQSISDDLRRKILTDSLPPGTKLPSERELMGIYSASRASIREAIRLLEADGLITVRPGPGGGIRSAYPDPGKHRLSLAIFLTVKKATVGDFYQFRMLVEPEIARLAARNATDRQRADLLEMALAPPEHYSNAAAAFHEQLALSTNSVIIEAVLSSFFPIVELHTGPDLASTEELDANRAAHRSIARAVVMKQEEEACKAMRRHLEAHGDFIATHNIGDQPVLPPSQWNNLASGNSDLSRPFD